eukprot:5267639-Prymnesium_polylepis.1
MQDRADGKRCRCGGRDLLDRICAGTRPESKGSQRVCQHRGESVSCLRPGVVCARAAGAMRV